MDLASLIAQTQAQLGAIITKPSLTEQLLSKPPFRFLHDVVSAVTAATGFADGLFSGNELNARAIDSKQDKIDYLTKIIDYVAKLSIFDAVDEFTQAIDSLQALSRAATKPKAAALPLPVKEAASAPVATPSTTTASARASTARAASRFVPAVEFGVNGSDFAKTQELLQKHFAKPRLTDALLGKPPFRFLHDIVVAVLSATGFPRGLYNDAELDAKNINDRDAKIAFLDKLINFLGIYLNTHLNVRSGKIVAGAEPEFTNEMLQLLAIAVGLGSPPDAAIKRVLAGETQPAADGTRASAETSKTSASAETAAKVRADEAVAHAPAPAHAPAAAPSSARPRPSESTAVQPSAAAAGSMSTAAAPSDSGVPEGGPRFVRPKTAQRRPPKIKETAASAVSNNTGSVTVLFGEGEASDSDEEGKQAEEQHGANRPSSFTAQGKHTRDILGDKTSTQAETTQEEGGGIRLGRLQRTAAGGASKGVSTAEDIELLRQAIQQLCANTIPLGKSMDYLTEDVEDMKAELKTWRTEYKRRGDAYLSEVKETEEVLAPARKELEEVNERISEMQEKITQTKSSIAKNDARIRELTRMVIFK